MRVAILDLRRKFTPIVDYLIDVLAAAHYRTGCTGFVGSSYYRRSIKAPGRATAGILHGFGCYHGTSTLLSSATMLLLKNEFRHGVDTHERTPVDIFIDQTWS